MKKNWVVCNALLLVVGAVAFHFYQLQRVEKDIRDIREMPAAIGEWRAKDLLVREHDYDILETRNLVLRDYENSKGESVHLFVIYSETNRRVCHPPVVCLIGSGVTLTRSSKEKLTLAGKTFTVNRVVGKSGTDEQVVLYWYMLGNEFTDSYVGQQLRWVAKQATGKNLGGAMIRVNTSILEDGEGKAMERAKRFIQDLLPILLAQGQQMSNNMSN